MLNNKALCLLITSPDLVLLCLKNSPVPPVSGFFAYNFIPELGMLGSTILSSIPGVNDIVMLSLTRIPPVPGADSTSC